MTKSQLIEALAIKRQIPNTQARQLVEAIFDEMKSSLCNGERIEFRGFGSFSTKEHASYVARNPKTSENVVVPPRKRIRFRMSDIVFHRLNDSFLEK